MGKKKRGGGEKPKKTENRKIKNEAPKIYLPQEVPPKGQGQGGGVPRTRLPDPDPVFPVILFLLENGDTPLHSSRFYTTVVLLLALNLCLCTVVNVW